MDKYITSIDTEGNTMIYQPFEIKIVKHDPSKKGYGLEPFSVYVNGVKIKNLSRIKLDMSIDNIFNMSYGIEYKIPRQEIINE